MKPQQSTNHPVRRFFTLLSGLTLALSFFIINDFYPSVNQENTSVSQKNAKDKTLKKEQPGMFLKLHNYIRTDYISKPYDENRMLTAIMEALKSYDGSSLKETG